MGYVQLDTGIANFSKAIISFWFRIPTDTFTAMSAIPYPSVDPSASGDHMNAAYYHPPMYKLIPLIVFGSVETDTFAVSVQPSFIGVDCTFDGVNALACNLQTPVNGSVSGDDAGGPARPACFYMGGWTVGTGPGTTDAYVAPDTWHHALISFDISGSESATYHTITGSEPPPSFGGTSTFSWALDDVSKVGASMSPSGGDTYTGLSSNVIVSNWIIDVVADLSENDLIASFSGGYIAASGNPIGIPVSASFVSNNQVVEIARLQVFTGIDTDATDSTVRRLFVTTDGRPASQTLAAAYFGQAPDIRFDSDTDWITGNNRGTAGTFEPTGTIAAYDSSVGL